ncbi:N-6 DNA methylase [Thiomicrospira microaerophila]|uniref:N-6 DNA methylase n=1 Tax=Thiomicrospira microaerophila TaxID=406020 RepID=UPI0005CB4D15|nr:N-6 DNA methylase [Thiomicrospira microaerophila]
MAEIQPNFKSIDPWFEETFEWLFAEQARARQLENEAFDQMSADQQLNYLLGIDEPEPFESLEEYYAAIAKDTEFPIRQSRMNPKPTPEEIAAKKAKALAAKQAAKFEAEKSLQFYNLTNELMLPELNDKLSLFVGLAVLTFFHKDWVEPLRQASQQNQTDQVSTQLMQLYQHYQWAYPIEADKPEQAFNLKQPSELADLKSPLTRIHQVLMFFGQYYMDEQAPARFYNDLLGLIRRNPEPLGFYEINPHIKHMICLLMAGYGLDQHPASSQKPIHIVDGCAGLGLLTLEQPYPFDTPPIRHCEMNNRSSQTLAHQLTLFKNHLERLEHTANQGAETKNFIEKTLRTTLNNPLTGYNGIKAQQADVYLSFPAMPYTLNSIERRPTHSFGLIHFEKTIPKYASDAIWVQYAMHCLKDEGIGFLLVQDGFLRRSGYDAQLRKQLVNNQWVDFVISLHSDHARQSQYNQLSLLVLNKRKRLKPDHQIKMVYLREYSSFYVMNGNMDNVINLTQAPFWDEAQIANAEVFFSVSNIIETLTTQQLADNDYNLSFEHYLSKKRRHNYPKRKDTEIAYQEARKTFMDALEKFDKVFE